MTKAKTIFSLFIVLILWSCSNRKGNQDDTNLSITRSDTLRSGNGEIEKIEKYQKGTLESILFFKDGKVQKLINYLKIDGKLQPNEMYQFNETGDTSNNKSIYYSVYRVSDTISMNSNYQFKFVLEGHLLDSSILYLCNYDSNFILKNSNDCDAIPMTNFSTPNLSRKKKVPGWNYIRGRIDNFQIYPAVKNLKGEDSTAIIEVYVIDSFFVDERL